MYDIFLANCPTSEFIHRLGFKKLHNAIFIHSVFCSEAELDYLLPFFVHTQVMVKVVDEGFE